MQNSVMFSILLMLIEKRRVTRAALAEKYELSERTISRYMDVLAASGVPIYSARGPSGGYMLSEDYTLDNSFLTEQELNRLLECVQQAPARGDSLNRLLTDKLSHLRAQKTENRFLLSSEWLVIDAGAWHNPSLFRKKIDVINRAITNALTVSLVYIDRYESRTQRQFDPYYLALKEGIWYTYGYCHTRNDFRLFKLARIQSMFVTAETYTRQQSDVYEKLKGHFDDSPMVDLEIEFSSTILSEIEEWLGGEAVFERGYKYIAKAALFAGKQLIGKLLSFGSSIKILHPAPLRDEVLAECRRILKYSDKK